jgi:hypothetical protein
VIEEAYSVVDTLADEMREAFDALPEQLKDYHKRREETGYLLQVATDRLCGLVPTAICGATVYWLEERAGSEGKLYRPARRNNVVRSLQACIFRLSELRNEEGSLELIRELKAIRDILKSLEFPGMST